MSYPILRVLARMLAAPIIIFGLYVQFHGEYGPGGGFQAGVIVATAFILHALVFGTRDVERVLPLSVLRFIAALGVFIFAGTGFATVLLGENYLDYDAFGLEDQIGQVGGIIAVELGVGLTVWAGLLAVFLTFARRHLDPDEDEDKS
jgi:multicomponent Na+:H+ antiporter subunit B